MKHKTGMSPPNIYNALFIPIITLHTHNTRQYTEYEIEFCQTSTRQNTIGYVGPKCGIISWLNTIFTTAYLFMFKKQIFRIISDILR